MCKDACTQKSWKYCHLLLINMSDIISVASVGSKSCHTQNLILQELWVAFRCALRQREILGEDAELQQPFGSPGSIRECLVLVFLDLSQQQCQDTSLDWLMHIKERDTACKAHYPSTRLPNCSGPYPAGPPKAVVVLTATPSCRSGKEVPCPHGAAGNTLLWSYSLQLMWDSLLGFIFENSGHDKDVGENAATIA